MLGRQLPTHKGMSHVYWPRMQDVAQFNKGCILCCTSKSNNKKQGLYHPLSLLDHGRSSPWISWKVAKNQEGIWLSIYDSWRLVMPHKNTIKGQYATNMFLKRFGALWDTKEHHLIQRYQISQCLLKFRLHLGRWTLSWRDVQLSIHRWMGRKN